eukprot:TRINITY_DN2070_c0_g1_i3.p1 TRINITY_DN2070_c0_g1~~TRINITY_DN2070_c0_g1_i3.p1  ORF type:complete len:243 (-),score=47.20 TRINITY_DN2070_c0_g1_i3:51-779(-)
MGISSSKESERTTLRRPIPIGSPSLDSTFHIDYAVEEGGIPVTFYLEDSSYTDVSVSAWKEGSEFEAYQYPMKLSKSDGGFLLVANLEPGLYLYKYNADGKWIHSKSEPSKNNNGEIVNVMLVNEGNIITNLLDSESDDYISDIDQTIDELESYGKPKPLPTHLERALLNCQPIADDPDQLPLPHHVMLKHMYSRPTDDTDTFILGLSSRYKEKFITTVFYTVLDDEDLIEPDDEQVFLMQD